tara:strand:- start:5732 stop:5872 length:141 start_codon:yes stop_codon:yes gene_type:complete
MENTEYLKISIKHLGLFFDENPDVKKRLTEFLKNSDTFDYEEMRDG